MMKKSLLSIFFTLLPLISFAQDSDAKGLDERINDWFMPIATWWEGLVLTTVPVGGMLTGTVAVYYCS